MTFDPVPWLVAGGAQHSAEVGRTLAFAAMGGKEGIIGGDSLKVTAQASPAGSVRVDTGAVAIENTYAGQEAQMYVGRNISSQNVTVAATGGTPRSDLIIARIDDPQYGGTTPPDVAVGPYVKFDLVSNVGSSAIDVPPEITYPAIALARVDVPASTSAITNAMITDLRGGVAGSAGYKKITRQYAPTADVSLTAAPPGTAWPLVGGWSVDVPDWATKMAVRALLSGIRGDHHATLANYGKLWIVVGAGAPTGITGETTKYEVPEGPGGQDRHNLVAGFADVLIPAGLRGTTTTVKIFGQKEGSVGNNTPLIATNVSTIFLDVEFFEEPA